MPLYGSSGANLRGNMRRLPAVGAGVMLPAPLASSIGRWDAYQGIVPDTTNGGFKWNPESGSSVLQSISGTGPDYSATGLGGRPAMLLSTGKGLAGSPALSITNGTQYFFIVVQMAAPTTNSVIVGNSLNGALVLRVTADGGVSIERQNNAAISAAPAGSFPFNVPVLLYYANGTGTLKQMLRINKTQIAVTNETTGGAYSVATNSQQLGRATTTSGATDLNAAISFFNTGFGSIPTGTTLTDYEAAIYQRYVA